jgi:hypothetical protein
MDTIEIGAHTQPYLIYTIGINHVRVLKMLSKLMGKEQSGHC